MMHRYIPRLLLSLITCLVLLAGGMLGGALYYVDTPGFKQDVTDIMSKFIGRKVVINGPMAFRLYPWLALNAENVTMGEVEGFGEGTFMQVDELSMGVMVAPLLHNDLKLDRTLMRGATVHLRRLANGTVNYADIYDLLFGTNFPFESFGLQGLAVENSSFTFRDDAAKRVLTGRNVNISTGDIRFGEPLMFETSFEVEGRAPKPLALNASLAGAMLLSAAGDVESVNGTRAFVSLAGAYAPLGRPLRFKAVADYDINKAALHLSSVEAHSGQLRAAGWIRGDNVTSSPAWKGRAAAENFELGSLLQAVAPKAGLAGETDVLRVRRASFGFAVNGTGFWVGNASAQVDDVDISGGLRWRTKGSSSLIVRAEAGVLDIDRYRSLFASGGNSSMDDAVRRLEAFIDRWSADWDVRCDRLSSGNVTVGDVRFRGRLDQRRISANSTLSDASGGSLLAGFESEMQPGKQGGLWSARLRLRAKHVDLAAQQRLFNVKPVIYGVGDATADLATSGAMLPALASAAVGDVHVKARDGGIAWGRDKQTGRKLSTPYSAAELYVEMQGLGSDARSLKDGYGHKVKASLSLSAAKPRYALSARYAGATEVSHDGRRIVVNGGAFEANLENGPLPAKAPKAWLRARVDFDSKTGAASLTPVEFHILGAKAMARIKARRIWSKHIEISGALDVGPTDMTKVLECFDLDLSPWAQANRLRSVSLAGDLSLNRQRALLSNARLRVDENDFHGTVGLELPFDLESNRFLFDLEGNRLDLDNYLFPQDSDRENEGAAALEVKSTPGKVPLESLRELNFDGKLKLRELVFLAAVLRNTEIPLSARNGQLLVGPAEGDFYDGRFNLVLSGAAAPQRLDAGLKFEARNFQVGPFMIDTAGREYVAGTADMDYSLQTSGADTDQLLRQLHGTSGFSVKDGSYKFKGWNAQNATGETPLDALRPPVEDPQQAQAARRNVFSLSEGRFKVDGGVFNLTSFRLKSLLLDGEAAGYFSLPDNAVDLTIYAKFVAAPDVPIRLTGKLTDPSVSVSAQGLVTKTVQNILGTPYQRIMQLKDLLFGK
ncbi:MAG: AsmA protein [Desulfovibrionales bacterium]|nr:AsmA protein [Desulfovibrionales bacterium]